MSSSPTPTPTAPPFHRTSAHPPLAALQAQLKPLEEKIEAKLKFAPARPAYSADGYDARVRELEARQRACNVLSEEKRILRDISDLKKETQSLAPFAAFEKELEALRAPKNELSDRLREASRATRELRDGLRKLDAMAAAKAVYPDRDVSPNDIAQSDVGVADGHVRFILGQKGSGKREIEAAIAQSDLPVLYVMSQAERVTHAMLVPVQYQRILAHPDFDKYDLGSFKAKLSTSAPLRAQVKADCLARWPGRLIEIYGLTEGGGSCMLEANLHTDKLHTVGKPGFGVELKILDEQGRELPQGEVGEIAGRAEMMMKGYYKQDDKTRELFWRDADGRLFFKSGDMGKLDEDGFLILLDRKKDMIISGGFNVYAADIEVLLLKHPDVIDVAVIGVPSDQWGESPMALCVRRAGATVSEEAVREWANGQLSKTQRLVAVEFRDSLPRSTIGKIMKRELRAPYWEGRTAKI